MPQMAELEDESRIERRHWGEIESDEEESEDEESDMEEEDDEQQAGKGAAPDGGFVTPALTEGYNLKRLPLFLHK
jgi:hypothetical protein